MHGEEPRYEANFPYFRGGRAGGFIFLLKCSVRCYVNVVLVLDQVRCLQEQVQCMARDLAFLMDNDNKTHSPLSSHSPIPVHPNPFATLADHHSLPSSQLPTPSVQCKDSTVSSTVHCTDSEHNVQTILCPPVKSNPHPTCLPHPKPPSSPVHSHPSQNLHSFQSRNQITSATSPQAVAYLCNVPKYLSVDQVQNRLSSEGIDLNGCSITQPL